MISSYIKRAKPLEGSDTSVWIVVGVFANGIEEIQAYRFSYPKARDFFKIAQSPTYEPVYGRTQWRPGGTKWITLFEGL